MNDFDEFLSERNHFSLGTTEKQLSPLQVFSEALTGSCHLEPPRGGTRVWRGSRLKSQKPSKEHP